jgi:hypothetical protein
MSHMGYRGLLAKCISVYCLMVAVRVLGFSDTAQSCALEKTVRCSQAKLADCRSAPVLVWWLWKDVQKQGYRTRTPHRTRSLYLVNMCNCSRLQSSAWVLLRGAANRRSDGMCYMLWAYFAHSIDEECSISPSMHICCTGRKCGGEPTASLEHGQSYVIHVHLLVRYGCNMHT